MTQRFNRGEFWLLASSVEYSIPLPLLALPEWAPGGAMNTIDICLNRHGHGLDFQALVDTLLHVRRNGWIQFGRPLAGESVPFSEPDADEIAAFLRERGRGLDTVHYWLTVEGGAAWEAFARPRWEKYLTSSCEFPQDGSTFERSYTLETSDWQWLDKYLRAQATEQVIETGSMTLGELRPWQATYWKTLPFGLRCTFRSVEHRLRGHVPDSSRMLASWCEWR
ncbi:hypothetical protein [Dokdonella sp.]|uniref:hypothetical protein n=1 Tax=Dokdonella sp. TaxID=2291710 RepID=UPI001B126DED|nr:hypothetical protein [Dokdonella sp.]MBO9663132.1 hypothetical protein [Dokdonella sp.]